MRWKELFRGDHGRTAVLVFDQGDEEMGELGAWCDKQGASGARFTAIGALRDVTLGWSVWEAKECREIGIDEQVEVLTPAGAWVFRTASPRSTPTWSSAAPTAAPAVAI